MLGSTTFPSDLLIFLPFSSKANPCVKTFLYGALLLTATEVNNDDWNQPLC